MTAAAPELHTDRLVLRKPQADDLETYTKYCASERSKFVRGPFSASAAFDKFSCIAGHWILRGYGRYIITLGGQPIGHTGPHHQLDTNHPEHTWTLWDGAYEGHGYATEAARAAKDHLLTDVGLPRLDVLVLPENTKSIAIAERLGAVLTDDAAPAWYPGCLTYSLTQQVAA